jgi:phage-related protein
MKKTTNAASKKTATQAAEPKKAATKKTTTVKKKTVAKKTTAKTTYKPVKMNIQVQYNYHDVSLDDIENMVISHLVELGYKKTSILTLDIYYKAETSEVFYIAKTKDKQVLKNDEPLYI